MPALPQFLQLGMITGSTERVPAFTGRDNTGKAALLMLAKLDALRAGDVLRVEADG